MKEVELAKYFVDYLSCYDLYFEIPMHNTDIVAKHGNILMAFEVKTTLNFRVIEQAVSNLHYFHYSYICVPSGRNRSFAERICQDYGIGILSIHAVGNMAWGDVREDVKPRLNRDAHRMKKYVNLPEYSKRSIAGASGGDGTTMTPFKATIENVVRYVQENSDPTIKEVFEKIDHHYSSVSAAKSSLYQWIRSGVVKEFYFEKGIVKLTDNG